MEFVGKTLKKDFKGFGVFTGVVQSYDESSGFFEIVYADGDSEELDLSEVASLIMADTNGEVRVEPKQIQEKPRVGRKPKKRRRVERRAAQNEIGASLHPGKAEKETLDNMNGNSNASVDLNEALVVNSRETESADRNLNETIEKENEGEGNLKLNGSVEMKNCIDLNSGLDFNLNEDVGSLGGVDNNGKENLKKRDCIDLNLDADCFTEVIVNVDYSVEDRRQKECGFDLNLGFEDEATKDSDDINYDGQAREFTHSQMVREKGKMVGTVDGESLGNGELKEVHVSGDWLLQSVGGIGKGSAVLMKEFNCHGLVLKDGLEEPGTAVVDDGCLGDLNNSYRQVRGRRKRRKVLGNIDSTAEKVLRRSARRGSAKNQVLSTETFFMDELSASPSVSAVTEEKPVKSGYKALEGSVVFPPKLQLPPSSQSLNLDGIAVLDVFSIYACLRSFSTLLFLSPFELEDFAAALNSKSPSSLFDNIHVSILQTLRKHLEHLANEGSESASECLRSLNWGLLDAITWPIFMVEYLLIHREELNSGFDLSSLNLFRSDYYKQPASVKIEVLRCLCDDMIEVETIRSEVNRRSLASDSEMDFDRGVNIEVCKKRKAVMDLSGGSCSTEEGVDDTADWNFDECCLCKMDGSLICCDGCPAAYHSKCVGLVNALLPEGDWYCPECAIDRNKPWMKTFKSLRGAELLGIDPHGRLYFSSCGYLLVLDSGDNEFSFNYYHRDDLNAVINVLKTSDIIYGDIIKAIYKQWHISAGLKGASSNFNLLNSVSLDRLVNGQIPAVSIQIPPLASSNTCPIKNETNGGGKPKEFVNLLDTVTKTEIPCVDSEGSDETAQMGSHDNQGSVGLLVPGNPSPVINEIAGDTSKMQKGYGYMNSYAFAQTASSVLEELMPKLSDKKNGEALKSEEEIISTQMKTILKKSNRFQWPDIQHQNTDVQKEKCGWCFTCRYPTDDMDCLFNMIRGPLQAGSKSEFVGLQLNSKRKGHLIDVISHIISIENRLHGLLLGPWLNPQYTKTWHESILKASDAASVKHLLLMLEANLHRLALSADWLKPVDPAVALGSAYHAVTTIRTSSKHGIARKRGRLSEFDVNPTSSAAAASICWWRGGQLSRQLFSWKVLPRSLVSQAARQAGRVKIPGILYPENSDFAKRNKYIAWQAAVESSTSVEQVALQVRELDSNIRWDDIENTHPLPALGKEFKKSIRLFKKCVIRRKSLEGEEVRYLLDFGKRRSIPEIVMKNGTMVEESSSERKKYWLSESYVPLHLLRSFEEKRIARKSGKANSEISSKASRAVKKSSKTRGFSYLFARAERPDYHQCGHCNKDVPIREAVCCQYCKGFFHKRHVRRSFGAIPAKCTYTCHRCQSGKWNIVAKSGKSGTKRGKTNADAKAVKSDTKRGKINTRGVKQQSLKYKKSSRANKSVWLKDNKNALPLRRSPRVKNDKKVVAGVPLRRSSRKVKSISVQSKKRGRPKKVKKNSKKKTTKKSKEGTLQKKRTNACPSYWLNGLLLSRKDNDARVVQFKGASFFAPSEDLTVIDQPKCLLCCESGYTSRSDCIACELCGGWYHGDAYGLDAKKKDKLIGFRCHVCRKRTPPLCPHKLAMRSEESQLVETQLNDEIQCPEIVTDSLQGSLGADNCLPKEHSGISLDTNQGPLMECELEAEEGKNEMQNTD